jgi:hypothetical protein
VLVCPCAPRANACSCWWWWCGGGGAEQNDDESTSQLQDIKDVPAEKVSELREWFRNYKTAEGKPPNRFGLDEKAMNREYAERVGSSAHTRTRMRAHAAPPLCARVRAVLRVPSMHVLGGGGRCRVAQRLPDR